MTEQNYSLSVFNSGSYISSTDVEAIFERFYQVDGPVSYTHLDVYKRQVYDSGQ